MRWWIAFCWFAVLASSGWNARITKRALFTKGLITNVLTNRTAELAKTFGHVNGKVGQKIGKEGATLVNPFSSHTGSALETLGNKSLIISESVGNTTADIIAKVFKDEDIIALQDGLAKALHIHNPKYMDADEFRRLLGTFSFINVKTRLLSLDVTFCGICQLFINGIQLDAHIVTKVAEFVCTLAMTLRTLNTTTFCQDIIQLNLPVLQYIVDNSEILDPELACTILLQSKGCHFEKPALSWTTALPVTKPIYPEVPSNSKGKKTLKILHLTDPHISSDYENGAVANCGYPICCKKGLGNQFNGDTAGYWGHYDCDIPPWLFSSTLNHINHTHKDIDFIYFTGDIIDHTVWASSVKENSELINYTFTTLEQTFPNKSVYPVIGNHESTPLNIYAPANQDIETKGLSTSWLYTLMAKLWKPWLSKESLDTVTQQGYYAYSVNKKLKVIGLNNNVCYKFNWWLLYDTQYINEQLQFLANELVESENNGQYVHILAHVSVGNKECIEPWEASYNALVKRFSHIIKGQFVGHTHTDELKIFYDDNGKPINMAYNGASLTPFEKYNPNYKILEVDPDTMDIIDIHTYIFNLTEANLHEDRSPAWYKLYSMKEAYGMADLSPESFDNLAERMNNNATLLYEYWRYYVRDGDASLKMGCDEKCKREIFCQVITTYSFHPSKSYCDDV